MKSWHYLKKLSDLPPRGSATQGEKQAAAWLQDQLQDIGYDVAVQPFKSPRHTLYIGPVSVIAAMLVATWLSAFRPSVAALLAVVCLIPLVGEMLGTQSNFDLLLPKRPSQNVVARPRRAKSGSPNAADVIIVAHYDTQWGSWLFAPRFRPLLQPFFIVTYSGLILALVGVLSRWALPQAGWTDGLLRVATVLLIVTGAFLVGSWLTGRAVPGANDNGSGVAVALALAARWQEQAPGNLNPAFLFTGCEEVGLRGMHHFLAETQPHKDTMFVNLDNVGGGRLRYLLGEGMLAYQHYASEMIAVAEAVAKSHADEVRPLKNLLLPTDGLLSAKAGHPTITFLAANDDGSIPHYHWHTDTVDHVDRHVVELTETFVWEYLEALADRVTVR